MAKSEQEPEPIWLSGYYAGFNITLKAGDDRIGKLKRAIHSLEHRPGVVDIGHNVTSGVKVWIVSLEKSTLSTQSPREARKLIDNLLSAFPSSLDYAYYVGTTKVDLRSWRRMVTGHPLS